MEYKDIMAITGFGGLFELISSRTNGLIVRSLDEEKSKFISSRLHQFTTLENIAIYTNDDSVELRKVFQTMLEKEDTIKMPDNPKKASSDELKKYFVQIVPDYDEEKVYVSDIKKIIAWFNILKQHDLIKESKEEKKRKADAEKAEKEKSSEEKSEKKASDTKKKEKAAESK